MTILLKGKSIFYLSFVISRQICCKNNILYKYGSLPILMSGWRPFIQLRLLETICTGRAGTMFPRSFYRPHNCPSTELHLHRDCIYAFKNVGWQLVAHEWKAKTWEGKEGVGDLVFKKGNIYLVIECKRKSKPKVYDQAIFYSKAWAQRNVGKIVLYGIWTCKSQELLGRVIIANFCTLCIDKNKLHDTTPSSYP